MLMNRRRRSRYGAMAHLRHFEPVLQVQSNRFLHHQSKPITGASYHLDLGVHYTLVRIPHCRGDFHGQCHGVLAGQLLLAHGASHGRGPFHSQSAVLRQGRRSRKDSLLLSLDHLLRLAGSPTLYPILITSPLNTKITCTLISSPLRPASTVHQPMSGVLRPESFAHV